MRLLGTKLLNEDLTGSQIVECPDLNQWILLKNNVVDDYGTITDMRFYYPDVKVTNLKVRMKLEAKND